MSFEKIYGKTRECLGKLAELHKQGKKPIEIAEIINPYLKDSNSGYINAISELVRDEYIYADWDDSTFFDSKVMRYNYITVLDNVLNYLEWEEDYFAERTPHFTEKEQNLEMEILHGSARDLLVKLIEIQNQNQDLTQYLANLFEGLSFQQDTDLRSTISYLIRKGYLDIPKSGWADDVPMIASLTYEGRNYLSNESRSLEKEKAGNASTNNIHIGTLTAPNSNLVLGNATNIHQEVDNSIHDIEKQIEEKGGDDKEELHQLLAEARQLSEKMLSTKSLPEKTGFFQRLSTHLEKHGWFYGAITELIGTAAITLL